jgi:hypothetical protein
MLLGYLLAPLFFLFKWVPVTLRWARKQLLLRQGQWPARVLAGEVDTERNADSLLLRVTFVLEPTQLPLEVQSVRLRYRLEAVPAWAEAFTDEDSGVVGWVLLAKAVTRPYRASFRLPSGGGGAPAEAVLVVRAMNRDCSAPLKVYRRPAGSSL